MPSEIERYVARCIEMSADGEYQWWSRLAEILASLEAENVKLRAGLVKPLTWVEDETNWWSAQPDAMLRGYEIRVTDRGAVRVRRGSEDWTAFHGTVPQAKAHWQADYERCILSALTPTATVSGDNGDLQEALGLLDVALSSLDAYADPTAYLRSNGEMYAEDEELHPGLGAEETAKNIRAALTKIKGAVR